MPPPTTPFLLRPIEESDNFDELTSLLHRAYKRLLDMGLRFLATSQSVEDTRKRASEGACYVAIAEGCIVGTITYYPPERTSGSPFYERSDVAHFGQFAVEPSLQQSGVGAALLSEVERVAQAEGVRELALDTSEHATHLIAYYTKKGYRFVEHVRWSTVNYRSVILSKALDAPLDSQARGFAC